MTLGSHQTSIGKTQLHITPRWIIEVLGPFDLDPAAADPRPWDCAAVNYTERDDGLRQPWFGRPFLNPPFDRYVVPLWIRKLARHGCGTALLHARTETDWFEPIWESATAILFMADRLSFYRPDGTRQPANSGAPPVLVAFGSDDAERLKASGIPGAFVPNNWTWPEVSNMSAPSAGSLTAESASYSSATTRAIPPPTPARAMPPSHSRSRSSTVLLPKPFAVRSVATATVAPAARWLRRSISSWGNER